MPDMSTMGRWLILAGLGIALLGGLLFLLGKVPFLGHLPGDIHIQTGRVSCFVPIVSMLLISLILTIVLNVIAYFLNRR
jgi:hypothetical protein